MTNVQAIKLTTPSIPNKHMKSQWPNAMQCNEVAMNEANEANHE